MTTTATPVVKNALHRGRAESASADVAGSTPQTRVKVHPADRKKKESL